QIIGFVKFSVPIATASAPASKNSNTSSAEAIPPIPIIGKSTWRFTSLIILIAIGLIALPDSPPVLLAMIGFLLDKSIRILVSVLIIVKPSAPAVSIAWAMPTISVTFGDNFT